MGFLDFIGWPKSELRQAVDQWRAHAFPGGQAEMDFKAETVRTLSNGKLSLSGALKLYADLRIRYRLILESYRGEKGSGLDGPEFIAQAIKSSKGVLQQSEAAEIIFYVLFDKVNQGLDSEQEVTLFLAQCFGSDSRGVDADMVECGVGEFGFEPTNPIPVRGIAATSAYLLSLRTLDGRPITFKRTRSITVPNVAGSVDEYDIFLNGGRVCNLYISPYNQRVSSKAPEGFIIAAD